MPLGRMQGVLCGAGGEGLRHVGETLETLGEAARQAPHDLGGPQAAQGGRLRGREVRGSRRDAVAGPPATSALTVSTGVKGVPVDVLSIPSMVATDLSSAMLQRNRQQPTQPS